MRIVNRKEFMALPSGTLYQQSEEGSNFFSDGMQIKFDTIYDKDGEGIDWACMGLGDIPDGDFQSMLNGYSKPFDPTWIGRDGLYYQDAKFVIYDKQDIQLMLSLVAQ